MLSLRYLTTTVLSVGLLVLPTFALASEPTRLPPSLLAQAQSPSPEAAAIDQLFRSNSAPPGSGAQAERLFFGVKALMGSYRGVQREGNRYLATFERGSLPVSVRLDSDGQIRSMSFECPRSASIDLNQASRELRQVLFRCLGPHSKSLDFDVKQGSAVRNAFLTNQE